MKKLTTTWFAILFLPICSFVIPGSLLAQTAKLDDVNAAIRKEEMENSRIMHTLHIFTDLYGPRLTGSPNHVNAAKWAAREMRSWGFDKAELEPWEFGYPGWVNERNTGLMLSPVQDTLTYEVLSWTPSTKGVVTSDAFHLEYPQFPAPTNPKILQNPTRDELTAYLDKVNSEVNGKMVLVGKAAVIDVTIDPPARRFSDEDAKRRFDPANAATNQGGPNRGSGQGAQVPARPNALTNAQVNEQIDKFLVDNNAGVRVNDAAMDHGLVRAFNNRTFDITKVVPTVVMRNDDFGRITRLLADKTPVKLEFDIRSRIVPDGVTSYNVVGEITGTDKKEEVIMLGGHLDSWHAATGATDNAIGCATMMEAARILRAINARPRRTIRVACWSGEEEGLLGSQAYVKQHFGSAENPGPEFGKFDGYFNIDSGTGKARGMSVFGPSEAATVLREALVPFADLGVAGAISSKSRNLGGSDNTAFSQAGLPGIGVGQDPIEYFTTTWHTNLDTYERVIETDVKSSAIVIAAAVYALAMRDEMLPRFKTSEMPPLPTPTATPTQRP